MRAQKGKGKLLVWLPLPRIPFAVHQSAADQLLSQRAQQRAWLGYEGDASPCRE
jgi:hypothetical protein